MGAQVADEDSTSAKQSFRAHVGPHYMGDIETAKQCLDDSISLARAHPDFFVENSKTGLYIIVDNTLVPVEIIQQNA